MKSRNIALTVALCAMALLSGYGNAVANHSSGYGGEMSLEDKVMHKAMMIVKTQEESGLTDDQINEVKTLKHATKKALIQKDAAIDTAAVDIKHELYQDAPDLEKIHQLIDQKYALKNERAKLLADAYVKIKSTPTKEQWKKIKAASKNKD